MSATAYDTLIETVLHLPSVQRSQLAARLIESLDEDMPVSDAWRAEIHQRAAEIDSGVVMRNASQTLHSVSRP